MHRAFQSLMNLEALAVDPKNLADKNFQFFIE
jgi:hypothetical protein